MNAWNLADAFRNTLSAPGLLLTVANFRHEQDEQKLIEPAYPAVIFSATCLPLSASGNAATFTLRLECRSLAQDGTAQNHSAMVAEVTAQLLTNKAAVIADILAQGNFRIIGYSPAPESLSTSSSAFVTEINLAGIAFAI